MPLSIEAEAPVLARRAVIIANHSSYLDGRVISAALPGELSFTAKEELARQWIAGSFLRRLGPCSSAAPTRAAALKTPRQRSTPPGPANGSFPFRKGTFTRMPGLLGFRVGAFLAAVQAQVPVIPIVIRGTRSILRGEQWFPRRGTIHVRIGRSLVPDGSDFDAALRLRNAARHVILARCGEPDLVREHVMPPS